MIGQIIKGVSRTSRTIDHLFAVLIEPVEDGDANACLLRPENTLTAFIWLARPRFRRCCAGTLTLSIIERVRGAVTSLVATTLTQVPEAIAGVVDRYAVESRFEVDGEEVRCAADIEHEWKTETTLMTGHIEREACLRSAGNAVGNGEDKGGGVGANRVTHDVRIG